MCKLFSEMVNDEIYDTKYRYGSLSGVANELNDILYENAYLRAENKKLKEQIKMYQDNINESVQENLSNVSEFLKFCLNKTE